jgi:type I restriction enzyme S subunit
MSLPRYPKYKTSGAEWLGELPDGWEMQPLKYTTLVYTGNSLNETEKKLYESTDQKSLPYISSKDIDLETHVVQYENGLRIPNGNNDLKVAQSGTFLLCIEGGSAGRKVAFLSHDVCFVNKLCCFSSTQSNKFRFYFVQSQNFKDKFGLSLTGLIGGVSTSLLQNFQIPIPSLAEQTAIAEFLDRETWKIDELVAEQRRLMELLKEKRQAVISHAVTKGLNPNAPMTPSGIEWLGDVPVGWEVKRLKHLSSFIAVGIVVNPSSYIAEEGLPFIYGGDIREGVIDSTNSRRISKESSQANAKTLLRPGDLLTVRVGAPGVTAVVPPECDGGNCASVMLVRQGPFNSEWLCYTMNTPVVRFQVDVVKYGAAQEQFNISHAVDFWMPCPPRLEQDEIVAFLTRETAKFDALTAEAQRAIDLLKERRTALISAAVTGQIDVRQPPKN